MKSSKGTSTPILLHRLKLLLDASLLLYQEPAQYTAAAAFSVAGTLKCNVGIYCFVGNEMEELSLMCSAGQWSRQYCSGSSRNYYGCSWCLLFLIS